MSGKRSRDGDSAMTQLTVSIPNEIYDEVSDMSDWASGSGTQVSRAAIVREALANELTSGYAETNYIAKYQLQQQDD